MDHILNIQRALGPSCAQPKSLYKRVTGRFYTPELIGREVAAQVAAYLHPTSRFLRVIDPFCGDGRLINWLLEALNNNASNSRWSLDAHLWDCDPEAIRTAIETIRATADKLGIRVRLIPQVRDTFQVENECFGTFDAVITNPPWEVLKPDHREINVLGPKAGRFVSELARRDKELAARFPISQPTHKFSGWGTNLSRVGTEIAVRLCTDRAVCGIVSPASLFGDQVSRRLREWLFTQFELSQASFFPAEGRFFDGVDQQVVSFTMSTGARNSKQINLHVFDKEGRLKRRIAVSTARADLEAQDWTIPLHFGADAVEVIELLRQLPRFGDLEQSNQLWAGRELDETGRCRYLTSEGQVRFGKGVMVGRYSLNRNLPIYVSTRAVEVPTSAYQTRIAWRDVSRPNQKRRMQATIIPRGWVTGNSLHVAFFKDGNRDKLLALLLVLNSLVFEVQVRACLATAHVSLGVVRRSRIPNLLEKATTTRLAAVARRCLEGAEDAILAAEVIAARAFGFDRRAFERVVRMFPKITEREQDALLRSPAWK